MAEKKSKKQDKGAAEAPKSARPVLDATKGKKPAEPETPVNYLVPAVLGLAVAGAIGVWAKSSSAPPEPAAVQWPDESRVNGGGGGGGGGGGAGNGAGRPGSAGRAEPSQPPVPEPSGGFVLPTPQPTPPGAGTPLVPVHREPSSPDPRGGRFTLAEATADMPAGDNLVADIETNYGTFSCQLWPSRAPNTVANFVGLSRGLRDFWDPVGGAWVRRPYFDGTVFHRVIPGFMAQGGDVLRDGHGGPGYEFADENTAHHDQAGLLCMANHGPNTNGSQFFILEEPKAHLDGSYSVFGRCSPVELVRRITGVSRSPNDRPNEPVLIRHVRVHR